MKVLEYNIIISFVPIINGQFLYYFVKNIIYQLCPTITPTNMMPIKLPNI